MSLEELFRRARDRAQGEVATSVFGLQHGTRLQVSVETAQTRVLLVRSGTAFGACTVADDRLGDAGRAELCGKELVELFDHPLPEVRVAALDAHLGARRGWDEPQARVVELAAGTPEQRAAGRDAVVAELLGTEPGRTILLVGVVDPLVAAIRDRGCRPLLCDLAVTRTASGDPVVREVSEVLPQADAVLATGMTLGNGTFDDLAARCRAQGVPLALYAQTGSAIARELVDEGVLDAACCEPFPFSHYAASATRLYLHGAGR